jgi:AmmeMemoRadiSam system protein B
MIEALCAADGKRILQEVQLHQNACGAGAVAALAALMAVRGHTKGYLIEYATSHGSQPPETFTHGVGYAGMVY